MSLLLKRAVRAGWREHGWQKPFLLPPSPLPPAFPPLVLEQSSEWVRHSAPLCSISQTKQETQFPWRVGHGNVSPFPYLLLPPVLAASFSSSPSAPPPPPTSSNHTHKNLLLCFLFFVIHLPFLLVFSSIPQPMVSGQHETTLSHLEANRSPLAASDKTHLPCSLLSFSLLINEDSVQ